MTVEMESLMPIGEFAAASRLSQKALRLYGENGLLEPAWVDPGSGYRYYRPEQLQAATVIALLRRVGMPLAEIRAFLRDPTPERLDEYERRTVEAFAEQCRVLRYIKRLLKEESMYEVVTKRVDAQPYVSRSGQVYVRDLERFIHDTIAKLGEPEGGRPFTLFHGPVNNEENGPVEVCVPKGEGDKRLPAGEVALTGVGGDQCNFPEILGAYEAVYRWVKENGRDPDGPAREIYLTGPDEEPRMEIAVPLR